MVATSFEGSKEEFDTLIAGDKVVCVDFTASWCGPCKVIGPVFVELSNKAENADIIFIKVDVDEQQEISADQGISAMPTFRAFKDGKMIKELVGASKDKLEELVAFARSSK